ncbi:MAG: hypothetical protein KJI69_04975 [Patescibacteria group bacterium]|nr:hypothetical protein [Patescibacteria group bacterium]
MDNKELKEIGAEMNTQDNRSTHLPLFVVQNKVQKIIYNHFDAEERELREDFDSSLLCSDCTEKMNNDEDDYGCEECGDEAFFFFNWDWEFDLRAGLFFTGKACDEHIRQNNYHYHREARSYAVSAWRNPEMETVMEFLKSLK